MACAACGFSVEPDFAFCPKCGARLAGPRQEPAAAAPTESAPEADRRAVTVLFADLAGFTALSERLDPEEVRAFQSELFQELAAAVLRYEGFVEKFVGDAVMAVFGAPVAHEDDPERALRAALAMHERAAALNRRWERRVGRPLALHIGVNTGPVVAGSLGSTRDAAYAVTGDTVNTASRLQHAAEPGHTLVAPGTYRLTQHAFAFEPFGELLLKGKADRLPVYRVLGALAAPRSARGLEAHGLRAPLVGRDDELHRMRAALDRTLAGRAQVVSLVGDAGVGKTRLLGEFLAGLDADRRLPAAAVRRAACASLGEQTHGVLAAFLRDLFGIVLGEPPDGARGKLAAGLEALGAVADETAAVAPFLGHVLGLPSPGVDLSHLEPEQLKRQIFLAARTLFERRLRQGPLVLAVEDLHWADVASIELLGSIVERLADLPLMLLLAYRPSPDARTLVTGRVAHTAIRLEPLSAGQSDALLDAFFGPSADRVPTRLRELVVTRAGGNPLYLEEVVRGLIAAGALVREDGGWACRADAATVDVPPTIQGLLLSRVDRLPPEARRLLQEAAVLGLRFDATLLGRIASEPAAREAILARLEEAQLIEAVRGTSSTERQYRFSHALVQEVVYQNLLLRRRTELHGRAGRALEALGADRPEDIGALGHHFSQSDDKPRGARYLLAAGDRARASYANDDAVRHYERALVTLAEREGCQPEQLVARERLGDLLGLVGRRDAALAHYEAVIAACDEAADRPAAARVQRKIGGLHWDAGDRPRALACCRTGLALLDGHGEHIELAHLYQEMGRIAFRSGDNQGAVEWAEKALAHAERLAARAGAGVGAGEPAAKEIAAVMSQAYNTLGVALARLNRPGEAVAHIERSAAVAQAEGLLQAACRSYANLGVLYSTLDPNRAIETCLNGLELAKKIGDLGFQSRLYANLAVAYCALTNSCDEQGVGAAQTAIELDRRLGQIDHLAVPLIVLGQIYQCHGEPQLALSHYQEALGLAEDAGEPQLLFPCYDGLATLHLEMGDEARAEEYMLRAQRVCEEAGLDPDSLVVLPFLG